MCTFFIDYQSSRELRITSVIIIAIAQKKHVYGEVKCNGLTIFSQGGGKFKKSTTHVHPPPPTHASSLWFPPSPFTPHLRCCWLKQSSAPAHLQGCSLVIMGDPSAVTGAMSYLMDQSRGKPPPERRSWEMTSSDPAPSTSPLVPLSQGHWDKGGEGGGVVIA